MPAPTPVNNYPVLVGAGRRLPATIRHRYARQCRQCHLHDRVFQQRGLRRVGQWRGRSVPRLDHGHDVGDGDTGSNNVQNFPVLARASSNGNTTVVGTLDSAPGTYTVELFSNAACDTSNHGEGETFLSAVNVTIDPTTNPSGYFSFTLPAVSAPQVITATATDAGNNTSEFSACRSVTPPPGVTVVETGGTAVTEGGAGDTLSVVLNAPPTANVTVSLTTGTQLQPIADLVFTPANWNTAQTVNVAAVDDPLSEGPHSAPLGLTATSTDPGYTGLVIPSITVSIADNDTPGFTVNPISGLTTTEAGGTATFTVRLNTVPTAVVAIPLTSSDTTEGVIGPPSSIVLLTFQPDATALNPQTVTITGIQDALADGPVAYTIVTRPASSTDPNYNAVDPSDVAVTNTDDEGAVGLSISDATVTEGDAGAPLLTFTVTLTPPSSQMVTVNFATADGTALGGATGGLACAAGVDYLTTSGQLIFQPNDTQKPITVTVCPDTLTEGAETVLVNLSSAVNSTIGDGQGIGTIGDNDTAGTLAFSAATAQVAENAGQRDPDRPAW